LRTYLIDTCIWGYWFNIERPQHAAVMRHANNLPRDSVLGISVITWGEIAYGHKVETSAETSIQNQYLQFVASQGPTTFGIDTHIANVYGKLRASLFERYVPKNKRSGLRPEQIINPATSLSLGIQENDLWIVAQAMTRNLTLVTHDNLSHIREVAGIDLYIEDWAS